LNSSRSSTSSSPDVEPDLPADERHPVPECQQRLLQPVHQRLLELALRDPLGQGQVVEHVRVADQLLRQLRIRRRQRGREVRRRRPRPLEQAGLDLVDQHVAGPAVLARGRGIPVPLRAGGELVEQHPDMPPRQLSLRALKNIRAGDSTIDSTVTLQSAPRFDIMVLAAHPSLSIIEDQLSSSWGEFLGGKLGGARRSLWARQLISTLDADIVIFDLGPSLGALNLDPPAIFVERRRVETANAL